MRTSRRRSSIISRRSQILFGFGPSPSLLIVLPHGHRPLINSLSKKKWASSPCSLVHVSCRIRQSGTRKRPDEWAGCRGDKTGGKRPARMQLSERDRLTCRGTEDHHGWGCPGSFREGSFRTGNHGRMDAFVRAHPVSGRVV
jgi:hypothetical protein